MKQKHLDLKVQIQKLTIIIRNGNPQQLMEQVDRKSLKYVRTE